jgi:carbamoyl-phosphate synthase large subunit
MNVLLTSAGRRVELLRILQEDLEHTTGGIVVAADASEDAPCMHLAPRRVLLPRVQHAEFPDALLGAIVEHDIGLVVPTIDTELAVLATLRSDIEARGARVLLSGSQTIAIAGDKAATHDYFVKASLPHPRQWSAPQVLDVVDEVAFPVFVKPRRGSASIGVILVNSAEHLRAVLKSDSLVQEVAPGQEFTVDIWVDHAGAVRSSVARRRIAVRGGEVEKGVTERCDAVIETAVRAAEALPDAFGPLTIQVFVDGEDVRLIEINARYGGGFPLAWAAGARTTRWAIQFGSGLPPSPAAFDWKADVKMLRYDQSVFMDAS